MTSIAVNVPFSILGFLFPLFTSVPVQTPSPLPLPSPSPSPSLSNLNLFPSLDQTSSSTTPFSAILQKQRYHPLLGSGYMDKQLQSLDNVEVEAIVEKEKSKRKRMKKKRAASELESEKTENFLNNEPLDGVQTDDDLNEPTMGEKLAILKLADNEEARSLEKGESSPRAKPPSADSVHVLLKQALHADDRALLLDCLNRHDEKVVSNSVSQLNPSDVFKLLDALISIIHSRGAVLVCALPWLRSLLLQHAGSITSQESSLLALNSLDQLIKSRNSTFKPALQLLSSIDMIYSGTVEDAADENGSMGPLIYEDYDDSDEDDDGSEEAMETDEEDEAEVEALSDVSDFEGVMA